MIVRDTARTYPTKKTSSNARTLKDVKKDMEREKQNIYSLRDAIEDYDSGWADDFDDTPGKRAGLEQKLKTAEDSYAQFEKELKNHPDYYADTYKDTGELEKALTGILGSTIATVPVVVETTSAALKEAEKKGGAQDYMAALQAEEIAKNKMNDYASSYFGFYDMIDQDELNRLTQVYQQASDYRKSLEGKYEEPVSMDSWGMDLMRESTWLKNSATENLDGFGKTLADAAIDIGQGVALSPLLLAGGGAYTAGVAANAAAEDMFEQTAKGTAASKALGSGALTAGKEVLAEKITKVDVPTEKVPIKTMITMRKEGTEGLKNLAKEAGVSVSEEGLLYLMDYLVDRLKQDPNAEFNPESFFKSIAESKAEDFSQRQAEKLFEELERAWKTIG